MSLRTCSWNPRTCFHIPTSRRSLRSPTPLRNRRRRRFFRTSPRQIHPLPSRRRERPNGDAAPGPSRQDFARPPVGGRHRWGVVAPLGLGSGGIAWAHWGFAYATRRNRRYLHQLVGRARGIRLQCDRHRRSVDRQAGAPASASDGAARSRGLRETPCGALHDVTNSGHDGDAVCGRHARSSLGWRQPDVGGRSQRHQCRENREFKVDKYDARYGR